MVGGESLLISFEMIIMKQHHEESVVILIHREFSLTTFNWRRGAKIFFLNYFLFLHTFYDFICWGHCQIDKFASNLKFMTLTISWILIAIDTYHVHFISSIGIYSRIFHFLLCILLALLRKRLSAFGSRVNVEWKRHSIYIENENEIHKMRYQ